MSSLDPKKGKKPPRHSLISSRFVQVCGLCQTLALASRELAGPGGLNAVLQAAVTCTRVANAALLRARCVPAAFARHKQKRFAPVHAESGGSAWASLQLVRPHM